MLEETPTRPDEAAAARALFVPCKPYCDTVVRHDLRPEDDRPQGAWAHPQFRNAGCPQACGNPHFPPAKSERRPASP